MPRGSSIGRNLFGIRLAPLFIPRVRNVLADSLSRPHQLPSSKWSLNMDVFRSLRRQWPVMIEICATSDDHRCSIYSRPTETLSRWGRTCSSSPGTVSWRMLFRRGPFFPRCWRSLECLAGPFSPSSASTGLSVLGSWTSSSDYFSAPRPPLPASVSSTLLGSPQAGPSFLEAVQLLTRPAGFSSAVAVQASLARRPSSRSNYQLKWSVYRSWCRSQGHSITALPLQGSGFSLVAQIGSGP